MKDKEFIDKFIVDPVIKELMDQRVTFTLVGGAVVDIMEGRKPKDYDFTSLNYSFESNLDFTCDSKWATTYDFKGYVIQTLKHIPENFDFKISQSRLELPLTFNSQNPASKLKLTYDKISFENKVLIPVRYSKDTAMSCLYRIPHWKKKGYSISDTTYFSLLDQLVGSTVQKSSK